MTVYNVPNPHGRDFGTSLLRCSQPTPARYCFCVVDCFPLRNVTTVMSRYHRLSMLRSFSFKHTYVEEALQSQVSLSSPLRPRRISQRRRSRPCPTPQGQASSPWPTHYWRDTATSTRPTTARSRRPDQRSFLTGFSRLRFREVPGQVLLWDRSMFLSSRLLFLSMPVV